jgi:DNA-binding response OmpR family regulator
MPAMTRLLIVEDDPQINQLLRERLEVEYSVSVAHCLKDADAVLAKEKIDLIVLDGTLPDGDGYRYCSKLRNHPDYKDVLIIFLTGRAELQDKIVGFSLGADDYISKPFAFEELKLRIGALLKRSKVKSGAADAVTVGDLKIDPRYHKVSVVNTKGSFELNLTALEFKLLYYLATRDGEVCSRETLMKEIWGDKVHVTERAVDSHLSNLRKKIDKSAWTILSVHGVGYHWTRKDSLKKTA